MQARRLATKLAPVPWRRQGDVAHVVFEVEVPILQPVGMVELQGHFHHPSAEALRQVQALANAVNEIAKTHPPARRARLIVEGHRPDVHVGRGGLEVEKGGVLAAKLLHAVV